MRFLLIATFFLFAINEVSAQDNKGLISAELMANKSDRALLEKAESIMQDENFLDALPYYDNLLQKYPNDQYIIYKAGICYLSKSDVPEQSKELLKKVLELNPSIPDLHYYYGRALHMNYLFNEAIAEFETYIASKPSSKTIEQARLFVKYCQNAKDQVALPTNADIKNLGKEINSIHSEYVPVISSDEAFLIFTYRGVRSTGGMQSVYSDYKVLPDSLQQYYEDIFYSYNIGSRWLTPDPIENINTNYHDAAVALSADGQKLFLFKSTQKDNGDIYMSKLEGNMWMPEVSLGKNINTNSWEGSCSLSANERTLYFSSERPGGYGGKDIWKSELNANGTWGKPKNLGSVINSAFDEDAPFIHPDGKMLHFSSNGIKSMGGYDVFRTYLQDDGTWSKAQNIGYPINTVDDDIYYVVTADGSKGYYSSGRAGGYGKQDIYEVKPGVAGKRNALVSLKGTITLDDSPSKEKIRVVNVDSDSEQGVYYSNAATGKYLLNLPVGANYRIYFTCDSTKEDQIKSFNTSNVDYYLEATIDVSFYTSNVLAKRAKNKLSILNADGSVFKTSTQLRDGRFIFNYLPADEKVLFKLFGEDVEFINKLIISVSGVQKTLLRGKDKNFRYDYLYPEYKLLSVIPSIDSAGAARDFSLSSYDDIVNEFGKLSAESLSFTVQVGAYFEAHNFNYSHLVSAGKIETRNYNDGITRFTIGNFNSLAEAEEKRKEIASLGGETADAFVLAVYKGNHVLLKDLAQKNFYNK